MLDESTALAQLSNEGAERAVLACLMKEPGMMANCIGKITQEDFTNSNNAYLFGIMVSLYNKSGGKPTSFDITTLQTLAREKGVEDQFIEKSGGKQYIEFLYFTQSTMIDIGAISDYILTISSLSVKRNLYKTNKEFLNKIVESSATPEELIVQEQGKIKDIFDELSATTNKVHNIGNFADSIAKDLFKEKKKLIGIPTQFRQLDSIIEGLRRGTLSIVSAPRKTGKTAFLMNIGINVGIKQRIPTLMISTEMSDEEIYYRMLSNLSGVQEKKIRKGDVNDRDIASVKEAYKQVKEGKFYHTTIRGFTVEKIIGAIRRFVGQEVGTRFDGKSRECLIIFDYIKMPSGGQSVSKDQKEYKILGQIADSLKQIAGDMEIPILTACQTNRSGDVANSYELTWFCDTFMELKNRPEAEVSAEQASGICMGNQKLKIVANRGGEENHTGIHFEYTRHILSYLEVEGEKHGKPAGAPAY